MNDDFLQELAEGLRYITKWDDYDALATLRAQPENTKKVLIAAADLLRPLEKQLLFSMVKNANNKTIPAFETIPDPLPVIKDAMAARFKVGDTYLVDDLEITVLSIGTHGITGSGFVRLFTQIKTIQLVKELAIN
jgi:hypothetical protein